MPITLTWKSPERNILLARFPRTWSLDDYRLMVTEGAALINAEAHIVHVIYDFTETLKPPHSFMRAGTYAENVLPVNQGIVVFVGANILINAAVSMGRRRNLKCTRYVYSAETMELAVALIAEKSSELGQGFRT